MHPPCAPPPARYFKLQEVIRGVGVWPYRRAPAAWRYLVDGDKDDLDHKADKAHSQEANARQLCHLRELLLRAVSSECRQ